MPLYLIFFTSFLVGLSGALSPGPLLVVTIQEAIKKDYKVGPIIITGHSLLEFFMIIFLIYGFGEFLKREIVQNFLTIFGSIFLISFGILAIFSVKEIKMEDALNPKKTKNYPLFLKGIFISLSNPYWTIWWITIGITYLSISIRYGFLGIVLFFIGHILSDFLWYSSVSLFVFKSKKIINFKYLKLLSSILGIFLILFGCFLIFREII